MQLECNTYLLSLSCRGRAQWWTGGAGCPAVCSVDPCRSPGPCGRRGTRTAPGDPEAPHCGVLGTQPTLDKTYDNTTATHHPTALHQRPNSKISELWWNWWKKRQSFYLYGWLRGTVVSIMRFVRSSNHQYYYNLFINRTERLDSYNFNSYLYKRHFIYVSSGFGELTNILGLRFGLAIVWLWWMNMYV